MSDETIPGRGLQGAADTRRLRGFAARIGRSLRDASPEGVIERERERLFLWAPVAFGCGIAVYFGLPREPSIAAIAVVCALLALVVMRSASGGLSRILAIAALLAALGLLDSAARTVLVAGPVVADSDGTVPVAARVVRVEEREGGAMRLLVAPTSVGALRDGDMPRRLSLWMRGGWPAPEPGATVGFDAVLMPPPDAAVPGGFDYARQVWFRGIGGVGFITRAPVETGNAPQTGLYAGFTAAVERLRLSITRRISAVLPGSTGAIATALVTGLRGAIPEADDEALRASGLAHVLSISGLHMMLVVGTLFWTVRAGLALSPRLALTRPIKKWAAAVALLGSTGYLLLSGAEVATQRAYIMAAIMLVAILVDRPAITLRNVAIAALVVLALTPEALMSASFQMSFAATVALVAAYEALGPVLAGGGAATSPTMRYLRGAAIGLILTSLIAGLATAPYGAYHFNRVAVYGLVGNAAAMPLVSFLVMPGGLAAVFLMPLGLESPALAVMGFGVDGMMRVAETVASWEGAVRMAPRMPAAALLAMTAGGLWLALWAGPLRLVGLPVIAAGLVMTAFEPVPDLFVSRDAGTAALVTGEGGLVFLPRAGSDYDAEMWQRSLGVSPESADAARLRPSCDGRACIADNGRLRVSYVLDPMAFEEDCAWADVIVTRLDPPEWCAYAAMVIGPQQAAAWGASTLRRTTDGLDLRTSAQAAGDRPWTRRAPAAVNTGG